MSAALLTWRMVFIVHAAIETVAALSFILQPERQLPLKSAVAQTSAPSSSGHLTHLVRYTKKDDGLMVRLRQDAESTLAREARLVLCNLGGLLLSANAVALVLAIQSAPDPTTTRLVAGTFAHWHAWPCYRAVVRLWWLRQDGMRAEHSGTNVFGGPMVHLTVHVILGALFAMVGFWGI